MHVRAILVAAGVLALTGCASSDHGYAYCYDPYRGPVGYRYGPLEAPPPCASAPAQAAVFVSHEAGYRGPYVSGPHPVAASAPEAASPAAAR